MAVLELGVGLIIVIQCPDKFKKYEQHSMFATHFFIQKLEGMYLINTFTASFCILAIISAP